MDIQTKKLQVIQEILSVRDEKIIDKLECILKEEQQNSDKILKEKLSFRAIEANKNITEGKVYGREDAEKKINERLGI